jgi:predicted RNA binding protein YcfA (HicA-like mRNA interferase family)
MKVRDVIRRLERAGWHQVAQRSSHRQFRHPVKPGRVTVAGNPGQELAPGTPGSILRQAGLSREDR